jgi:hypothetical protein
MYFSPLSQALSIGAPERRLGVQHHIQLNFQESGFLKTPLVAACMSLTGKESAGGSGRSKVEGCCSNLVGSGQIKL